LPSLFAAPMIRLGEEQAVSLRGYTVRLRRSPRPRYRVARQLMILLSVVLFMYALIAFTTR
jgi:hypothetical protein